jgi:hypothetical protein
MEMPLACLLFPVKQNFSDHFWPHDTLLGEKSASENLVLISLLKKGCIIHLVPPNLNFFSRTTQHNTYRFQLS